MKKFTFLLLSTFSGYMEWSATEYSLSGDKKYLSGKYDEAIKDYEKALNQSPHLDSAYRGLAMCYFEKGEYKVGLKFSSHALRGYNSGYNNVNFFKDVFSQYVVPDLCLNEGGISITEVMSVLGRPSHVYGSAEKSETSLMYGWALLHFKDNTLVSWQWSDEVSLKQLV